MEVSNFNQELANQFVGAYAAENGPAANQVFFLLKKDAGLPSGRICSDSCDCAENCECNSIRYNDTVRVAKIMGEILDQIRVGDMNSVFGSLIPRFFCIAEKALEHESEEDDGETGSESSPEQSSDEEFGG
jgi:hypothetical protein